MHALSPPPGTCGCGTPDTDTDGDGNGLPDGQEPTNDPDIDAGPATGWRGEIHWLEFNGDDSMRLRAGLQLMDNGSSLLRFSHASTSSIAETAPENLGAGLFFFKLDAASPGASTFVRLYFSPAVLDENFHLYKYDSVNGWFDYTGYGQLDNTASYLTIELIDGTYGDADGTANGIIVDPLGVTTSPTVDDDTGNGDDPGDDPGDDVPPAASSCGGGGCFISEIFR